MKRLGIFGVLALHGVVGVGAVSLLFSLVFSDGRSPIESWQEQLRLTLAGLGRFPHGWYVAAAVASLAIVPAVAALGDLPQRRIRWRQQAFNIILAAAGTPFFYLALCGVLDFELRAGMSSYSRIMVWSLVPTALTLWAVLAATVALAISITWRRWTT
jgi:hypothetical protein